MAKTHAVGIDLGTTYSAMARLDETGHSAMVRNGQGELLTPSVVLFDDREIVVGKDAKKLLGIQPDRVADCVKRDMGNPAYSRPIRGAKIPPEVVQSCILRRLKNDISAALSGDLKVVITVPAYFDEMRRKATVDAAEMAGLDVLDIVNEPTAAALAYGEQLGYLDAAGTPRKDLNILVYDLGGGTFDITVLNLKVGMIDTLATDGDVRLGGRDWDERLANYLADQFKQRYGIDPRMDSSSLARLMSVAEETKHTLSVREQANAHLECAGRSGDVTVSRSKFEEITEDLLERTAYTTKLVLSEAKLQWSDINHILIVGGSTRMPMVATMLARISGIKPEHAVNPDEAVARGAALFAGYLLAVRSSMGPPPKFKVGDVNAHSLGIEGIDPRTLRKENMVIIPRNTTLPATVTQNFMTRAANQSSVVVQVLEGESRLPLECMPVARAVIRQLPANLPQGWPIEVTYEYGANGRLAVKAHVPGTKQQLRLELEREHGMSDERRHRWRRVITAEGNVGSFESMLDDALSVSGMTGDEKPKPNSRPADAPVRASFSSSAGSIFESPIMAEAVTPTSSGARVASPVPQGTAIPQGQPVPQGQPIPQGVAIPQGTAIPTGTAIPQIASPATTPKGPAAPTSSFDDYEIDWGERTPRGPAATGAPTTLHFPEEPSDAQIITGAPLHSYRPHRNSTLVMVLNLVGHVFFAGLGLALGYYILVWIRPEANYFKLNLPGLAPYSAPAEPGPP